MNYVGRYTTSSYFFTGDTFDDTSFLYYPSPTQSQQIDHDFYTRGEAVTSFFDDRWKNYIGVNYTDAWSLNTAPGSDTENNIGKGVEFNDRSVIEALPGETVFARRRSPHGYALAERSVYQRDQTDNGGYAELQSNLYNRFFLASNVRHDDYDTFGSHVTYRIAPAFIVPQTGTKLKATYGTGFKAPTL